VLLLRVYDVANDQRWRYPALRDRRNLFPLACVRCQPDAPDNEEDFCQEMCAMEDRRGRLHPAALLEGPAHRILRHLPHLISRLRCDDTTYHFRGAVPVIGTARRLLPWYTTPL
jgi:hypothetical protein